MEKNNSLGALAFKYRGGVWTALFFAILVVAHPIASRIWAGIVFVILGQIVRFWSAGCIKLYRGETVKAQELATWGPYALVRNPLYVGNGLIGLGLAWISGNIALVIFIVTFYVLYGLLVVPYEEAFLLQKFGAEYEDYKKRVGRFFPRSLSKETIEHIKMGSFDFSILKKSEIHSVWIHAAATALIISKLWW